MIKLKGWDLRAKKYEERISVGSAENIARECMTEKNLYSLKDRYREKRKRYHNRIGWRKEKRREDRIWNKNYIKKEIKRRKRNIQRKEEKERIKNTKCNTRYKEINDFERCPRCIKVKNLEEINRREEVRALIKWRCDNLENANKYWLNKEHWRCVFCENGKDRSLCERV